METEHPPTRRRLRERDDRLAVVVRGEPAGE
jgi:hypothetical protein